MNSDKHLTELTAMVDLFVELETSLEQYYDLCAKIFPDEKFAWFGIATQEGIHAKIFKNLKEEIIKNPNKWTLGKYNYAALKTMVDTVHEKLKEIREKRYVTKSVVSFAKDVEASLVESDIVNAFVSEGSEYIKMVNKIVEETEEHKEFMTRFISMYES